MNEITFVSTQLHMPSSTKSGVWPTGRWGTLDGDPQPEARDQACAAPHRGLQADAVLIYLTNCASYVRLCLVSFLVNYLELKFTLESSKAKKGKEVAAEKSPVNFSCYDTLLGDECVSRADHRAHQEEVAPLLPGELFFCSIL